MSQPQAVLTATPTEQALLLFRHIQGTGWLTTAQASRLMAVSPKRARAHLRRLEGQGVVQHIGEGRSGAWRYVPEAEPVQYSVVEAAALTLGRQGLEFANGTALTRGAAPAERTAMSRLPGDFQRNWGQKLRVVSTPARSYSHRDQQITEILDGLARECRLTLHVRRDDGTLACLKVHPLTLVNYHSELWLLAEDAELGELMRIAVEHVEKVEIGRSFAYPEDWDPDRELDTCFGMEHEGRRPERIVLKFAPEAREKVRSRRWHRSQRLREEPDGTIHLSMLSTGSDLVQWVLEWGSSVEVVHPQWLRNEVVHELEAALQRYRKQAG